MVSLAGLYHGSLGVLSLAATSISLVVLCRGKSVGKSPLGVCLTNLAVNQLGFAVFGHLTFVVPSHFAQHWVWGSAACDFFGFLKSYFQIVIFSCVLILCVERYMKHKHKDNLYTPRFFFKLSIGFWLYEAVWAFFPFLGWGRYGKKDFSCDIMMMPKGSEWKDFSYAVSFTFATFILPSAAMFHLMGNTRKSDMIYKVNKRVWSESPRIATTTSCFSGCIFFLFCLITIIGFADWLPSIIGGERKFHFETVHSMISHLLVFMNPLWYLIGVPTIRKELGRYDAVRGNKGKPKPPRPLKRCIKTIKVKPNEVRSSPASRVKFHT